MSVNYTEYGFRTRQSVYWLTTILMVAMVNLVIASFAVGNLAPASAITASVWLIGLSLGTFRFLKKL